MLAGHPVTASRADGLSLCHPRTVVAQDGWERSRRRARSDGGCSLEAHARDRFMKALQRNGFFEGEMEGSKRYREKVEMADVRQGSKLKTSLKTGCRRPKLEP